MPGAAPSLAASVQWLVDLLLGSLGATVAVLAMAAVGFGMLLGRLAAKDGLRIVLGMFVLFAAPTISQGLLSSMRGEAGAGKLEQPSEAAAPQLPRSEPAFDPYAGASVPTN